MAEPNAILKSDKSSAPTVALSLLCVLMSVELAAGVRAILGARDAVSIPAVSVVPAATMPSASAPGIVAPLPAGALPPLVIPPIPAFTTPIPSAGGLPSAMHFSNPLPAISGKTSLPSATANVATSLDRSVLPRPAVPAPASRVIPPQLEQQAPASPSTGNPQADDLLDVALQSRDLGDNEGALQALNRADLLVPNNPKIMREKALTLQRLNKTEEPKNGGAGAAGSLQGFDATDAPPSSAIPPPPTSSSFAAPSPKESLNQSFGSRAAGPGPAAPPAAVAAPPVATINGALSLGECRIEREAAAGKGERFSLKVPLIAATGEPIDPNQMIVDVMFYDKVNDERIELTMADKPKFAYDTPGDFKNGREVLSVLYNLPEFSAREIAELGRHVFYGYVVKLYYKNRLMGAAANPPDLSTMGEAGQGKRI